ncbi:MAG: carboxy-S-adenosyl-L-methionine synthase CmoA [Pseudonocardiaceae bacterium]
MTFDKLFQDDGNVGDFVFDGRAAAVFDDMLDRSIPFYREIQRMVVELGVQFIEEGGGVVYDIGCSTGNTLLGFMQATPADRSVTFVGVEPSAPMRDKCTERLAACGRAEAAQLWVQPIEDLDCRPAASVIVMLYTLQFVRPLRRNAVLAMCFESLRPGGCLLLGEKILSDSPTLSRLYIERYHEFKQRNGYSRTEIARKREALENVLVPYRDSENRTVLAEAGFVPVDQIFRWYNFAVYLAVKTRR